MISGVSGGAGGGDMSAMWQELLKKADKDGDGRISKGEFKAAAPQGGPGAENLFNKIDANGDGFIDESEGAAAVRKTHRGKPPRGPDPLQVFNKADKDGDGQINKSDFKAALPEGTDNSTANKVFDAMDTNQDGVVDAAEYMAALQKMDLMTQLFPRQGFSSLA